jgi:iron-sulfur cluster assembly protein
MDGFRRSGRYRNVRFKENAPKMETTQAAPTTAPATTEEKPAIVLTAAAVAQVKEVIKAQGFDGHFLTVRVVPTGCSGLGYDLNMVKESKPGDIIWEQDGVKIATDPMSKRYLGGTEVDFVSGLQGAGFKFNNPNAKSSCGCGSSFST